MRNIPLIIPNFNQLTYLKNIINWWQWYNPEGRVFIVDNASTYSPLLMYYSSLKGEQVKLYCYPENNCIKNLRDFIDRNIKSQFEYYVISDPDIMPHPNTPMNFLEIWIRYITNGFHRVGFNLVTDDLPSWMYHRDWIVGDEKALLGNPFVELDGFKGYKAPIDTTFALYTTKNNGWNSPMDGQDWGNSLRLFNAFHLGWYIDGDRVNSEMEYYFKSAKYRVPGQPSAGSNNNRPQRFINE